MTIIERYDKINKDLSDLAEMRQEATDMSRWYLNDPPDQHSESSVDVAIAIRDAARKICETECFLRMLHEDMRPEYERFVEENAEAEREEALRDMRERSREYRKQAWGL
jgi:hypothetical protein